jgi:hypothetical protein
MPSAAHSLMTLDEFLAWEREQAERFEFADGAVIMTAGGTAAHAAIAMNLALACGTGCAAPGVVPSVPT